MTAHYVYRLFDRRGRLIYVGCSKDPQKRMRQHSADHRWWYDRVYSMTTETFPGRAAALVAERLAIETEHPSCNIAYRWEVRETWGRQQFVDYVHALRDSRFCDSTGSARSREREARWLYKAKFGESLSLRRRPVREEAAA